MSNHDIALQLQRLEVNNEGELVATSDKVEVDFNKFEDFDTIRAAVIEGKMPAGDLKLYEIKYLDVDECKYLPISEKKAIGSLKEYCTTGNVSILPGLPDNGKLAMAFTTAATSPAASQSPVSAPKTAPKATPPKKKGGRRPTPPWRRRMQQLATSNIARCGDGSYMLKKKKKGYEAGECSVVRVLLTNRPVVDFCC